MVSWEHSQANGLEIDEFEAVVSNAQDVPRAKIICSADVMCSYWKSVPILWRCIKRVLVGQECRSDENLSMSGKIGDGRVA